MSTVLPGRKIILGISGGIAAYKAVWILRELVKEGTEVRVVMTAAAHKFVAPATLEVLSRHPLHTDLFEHSEEFPVLHVGLAAWADLVVIAPATANIIAKMANGLGDDLLSTLLLSASSPVVVAPAMEEGMLNNAAVQRNVRRLRERGCLWVEAETGELASGAVGQGRMAAPEAIVESIVLHLAERNDLQGRKVLVTAGPTLEDIDPVRFIGNRSSGRMGYALAQRARERGARVWLVAGPTVLPPPAGVRHLPVRSTLEMQAAVEELFAEVDGVVMAAAVADYRVRKVSGEKIKRGDGSRVIELVENPDIVAGLGRRKKDKVVVAFAAETEPGLRRAREKLEKKNCDLIVLNDLGQEGAGFGVDTNVVTLIDAQGAAEELPKMSKLAVADRVLDRLAGLWAEHSGKRS